MLPDYNYTQHPKSFYPFPSFPRLKGIRIPNFETPPQRTYWRFKLLIPILFLIASGGLFLSYLRISRRTLVESEVVIITPTWKIKPILTRDLHIVRDGNDDSDSNRTCVNTIQGRELIADSSGSVCLRGNVLSDGCCNPTKRLHQLSCVTCRADLGCCSSFEYCVSCCLKEKQPQKALSELTSTQVKQHSQTFNTQSIEVPKPSRSLDLFSPEDFDSCLHLCRTSSRNLQNGNQYHSDLKHCYTEAPKRNALSLNLTGSHVIVTGLTVSCHTACNKLDMFCIPEYLSTLNACVELQKYFPCKQCEKSDYQPSYIAPEAPPHLKPEFCFVHNDATALDCHSLDQYASRLCICVPTL